MSSARIAIVPAATSDTTAAIASARRRPSSQAAAPAAATPTTAAVAPERITPSPPTIPATTPSRFRSPSASASRPIASVAPESAARSWIPRNDGSRCPGPAALELVQDAEELEERPERRRGAPRGEHDEQRRELLRAADRERRREREQRVLGRASRW